MTKTSKTCQINFRNVPIELRNGLKAYCNLHGISMRDFFMDFIRKHTIKKNGKR